MFQHNNMFNFNKIFHPTFDVIQLSGESVVSSLHLGDWVSNRAANWNPEPAGGIA